MLHPKQVRQLVILGFLLLVAVALLLLFPGLIKFRDVAFRSAVNPPPPSLENAPAPPPSPFPPEAVILDGALKDVKDFTAIGEVDRDTAYRKLVKHVASLPGDALEKSCEGEIAYSTYIKYAPQLRGRIFRVKGESLQKIVATRLETPIEGREDIYRIFMIGLDMDVGFAVDLVDKPPEVLEERDRIEVEGMFYKVVRFQNSRNQDRDVPLLVARTFRRLPPPVVTEEEKEASWKLFLFKFAVVVGIGATLIIAFLLIRNLSRTRDMGPVIPRSSSYAPPRFARKEPGSSPSPPAGRSAKEKEGGGEGGGPPGLLPGP